ncbi:ligand-binding protein, receptor family [Teladorsagia circumcincta]|uniref:Ligand-binding protein, receptor family n=1 Tax=Teladorsagia circumcincta TaxID=45464 RepID=A0A2G9UYV7_TELCI|nr:ligand-binding protein, receptor family [Teladorsagia circumcincta]
MLFTSAKREENNYVNLEKKANAIKSKIDIGADGAECIDLHQIGKNGIASTATIERIGTAPSSLNMLGRILNVGFLCAYNNTEITPVMFTCYFMNPLGLGNNNTEQGEHRAKKTAMPYVGWRETAGGIGVAWDKIVADRMLPDYTDLNLTWVMGECVEAADAGALINWIQSGANVVIGPACSASALVSGTVAKYFDFPIVIWAPLFPSALLSTVDYTTLMAPTFSSINQAQTIVRFLQRYGWSDIAMIYYLARSSLIPRCSNIFNDLELPLAALKTTWLAEILWFQSPKPGWTLISICGLWLSHEKLDSIDAEPLNSTTKFVADVLAKMKQPPYNCQDCTEINPAIAQVGEVADAMLMYASALNKSIASGNLNPTGSQISDLAVGVFEGFTGRVIVNQNNTRDPIFYVWGLNSTDQQIVMMKIVGTVTAEGVVMDSVQPDSVLWRSHGGAKPLNRPLCDYDGKGCPLSFVDQYLAITLASVAAGILLIAIVASAIFYVIRARRLEEERLNKLWQIPFLTLTKASSKSGAASSRSLQSTLSTSTKLTIDSKKDSGHHSYFTIGNDPVVARKHQLRVQMKKADCAILRKDVIEKGSLQMDWFFKFSLIKDIIEISLEYRGG